MVEIDIVSDFVCPWCFVGGRRLMSALEGRAKEAPRVQLRWHGFFLNPDTPPEGEPYRAFMERKFGSAQGVDALHVRVASAARGDGLELDFGALRVRPATRAAHALVAHAQDAGCNVDALVMALFEAHFLRGENIGQQGTLRAVLGRCGLDVALLEQADARAVSIETLSAFAQSVGASGVPLFVLDRRYGLSGAQPVEHLRAAIDQCAAAAAGDGA